LYKHYVINAQDDDLDGALSSALERVDGAARKAVVAESWDDPLIDSLGKHLKRATLLLKACRKCVARVLQECLVVAESWDDPLIDSLGKHLKCVTLLLQACSSVF
jgi:hypothetical protein